LNHQPWLVEIMVQCYFSIIYINFSIYLNFCIICIHISNYFEFINCMLF